MSERLSVLGAGGGGSALERVNMAKASFAAFSKVPECFSRPRARGFTVTYLGFDDIRGAYRIRYPEAGTELGITGLAAIICLVMWSLGKARDNIKKAAGNNYYYAAAVLALFLFMLINAMKSGDINDNRQFFTSVGMIFALGKGLENDKQG